MSPTDIASRANGFLSSWLRCFLLDTGASSLGPRGVERGLPFIDIDDLAVRIDHEGGPVSDSHLWNQDTVKLRYFSHVVAEQREIRVQFLFELSKGRREIRADRQYLYFHIIETCDTRLVCS